MEKYNILHQYAMNTESAINNFEVANWYKDNHEYASAVSFYLRACDKDSSEDRDIAYVSLVKAADCLFKVGHRNSTAITTLLHATAMKPDRAEAHNKLSEIYESQEKWIECYSSACMAAFYQNNYSNLSSTEYPGPYAALFQKAVSSWWVGKKDDSKSIFSFLLTNAELMKIQDKYLDSIKSNLQALS